MSDLRLGEQSSTACAISKSSGLTKEDLKVLITAGLLLVPGTGISVGGCALRVREERQKYNEKKAKEVSAQEQKDISGVLQAPLMLE